MNKSVSTKTSTRSAGGAVIKVDAKTAGFAAISLMFNKA